jgi:glyoxylase-like metal-dependent hydrolase (beta-lactamase superfamily II)
MSSEVSGNVIKTMVIDDAVTQIKMSNAVGGVPLYWVSGYLVDDLLVDTGCNYTKQELVDLLKSRIVSTVVNTHHHEDHISGNHLLQSTRKVSILAHPFAIPLMKMRPKLYPYQELTWGYPDSSDAKPIPEAIETENHEFKVAHVPGHSFDHIALIEPKEGWIFVGDLFISVKPVASRLDENQWHTISSLKRIRGFAPRIMFGAVPGPVMDASSVLDTSILLREKLGRRIVKLNEEGLTSAKIVNEVFGKESQFERVGMRTTYKEFTQGEYSTENLVETFIHEQRYLSNSFPQIKSPLHLSGGENEL